MRGTKNSLMGERQNMHALSQYLNKVVEGDSKEILKEFPSDSIDCVCSDVPYLIQTGGVTGIKTGIKTGGILNRKKLKESNDLKKKWLRKNSEDDNISFITSGKFFENVPKFEEWLPEIYRILKDGSHCYLMINGRNLSKLQTKAEKVGFKYLNTLVWVKNNKTPNKYFMQRCEFILMLRKGYAKNINDMGMDNVFSYSNLAGNKFHPTEKPVELMQDLIKQSTNEGDIVLDMFCGSGSTLIGAKNLGVNFIGIEIEHRFCEIAKERLENAVVLRGKQSEQRSLF